MDQATQIIRELIKIYKGNKPTEEKNTFDQGVDAGLMIARRALLNAKIPK